MKSYLTIPLLVVSLTFTGCAAKKIANQEQFDQMAAQQAANYQGSAQDALENAEKEYLSAVDENLSYFSPIHMEQASTVLDDAKELQTDFLKFTNDGKTKEAGVAEKKSLAASVKVLALLKGAKENKPKTEKFLQAVFEQKAVLVELETEKYLNDEFIAANEAINDLIRLIESGDEEKAVSDRDDMLADLQKLEQKTQITIYWLPASKALEAAEDEDADETAAETFKEAEKAVEDAETAIKNNYKDRDQVKKLGLDALNSAKRAMYLGREAKSLQKLDVKKSEQAALKYEQQLNKIAEATLGESIRHMSFDDQVIALKTKIEKLKSESTKPKAQPASIEVATPIEEKQSPEVSASEIDSPETEVVEQPAQSEATQDEATQDEATQDEATQDAAAESEQAKPEQAEKDEVPVEEVEEIQKNEEVNQVTEADADENVGVQEAEIENTDVESTESKDKETKEVAVATEETSEEPSE